MSTTIPRHRYVQQLLQSQPFSIEFEQQARRERVSGLVDRVWSPESSQQAAA
jgi:hypothetical protein